MAEIGVVLKVPQQLHVSFKDACAKHDRSMQKILVGLIQAWLANGAPDPNGTADPGLPTLLAELKNIQARLDALESLERSLEAARRGS